MDPEAPKLSVWICQEEKLISGLSKRTTCADVVRALLEDSRASAAGGRRRARRGAPAAQEHPEPEPLPAGPPSSSSLSSSSSSQERVGGGGGVPFLSGPPASYCLVEKWRGFERILPAKTRLLRLWAAWGPEQENVRFVLLRSEASLPSAGPRSAEARVVPSKERPSLRPRTHATLAPSPSSAPRAPGPTLSHERQRRLVRKAFRKLAKLNRRKGGSSPPPRVPPPPEEGGEEEEEEEQGGEEEEEEGASPSGELPPPPSPSSPAERMETLVHLVLSQDHTIRQQLKRLRDLDREIDRYEARTHFDRMQRHGVNYVQETYLEGGEGEGGGPGGDPREQESGEREGEEESEAALALYERRCAQVAAAVEQRGRQEALLERLALEIQEELNQRWMRRRRDELRAARGPFGSLAQDQEGEEGEADGETTELTGVGGGELPVEQERLRTQLSTSLYIGLRLSTDLEAVKGQLEATRRAWERKEREVQTLADTLQALEAGASAEDEEDKEEDSPEPPQTAGPEAWDQVGTRTVGKTGPEEHEDDGEDSDTGLSSMHSQDSDSVPVCESLV